MYMNKRQIKKAYNDGLLDEVKKQCVMYGKIVDVKDWEYQGARRRYHVEHHSMQWNIEMHNGEVKSVGHNIGDHKIF